MPRWSGALRQRGLKIKGPGLKMDARSVEGEGDRRGVAASVTAYRPPRRRRTLAIGLAVVAPLVVVAVASVPSEAGTAIPAILFLLVVVGVSILGGLWPAVVAATVSALALDYFFTPPAHTFRISKAEDVVVLAIFVAVALASSAAISRVADQRSLARAREHQVTALSGLTTRLLLDPDLDVLVRDVAISIRGLYQTAGCRVTVTDPDGRVVAETTTGAMEGPSFYVPMEADAVVVGRIELAGPSGRIGEADRDVLRSFAGQLALGVARLRLAEEVATARLDAEASQTRAALFSSVTHDLRTPLASITASASSLLEPGVPFTDDQARDLLRTILEEAERLNRLVGNLMDLSRMRAGALTPDRVAVPLGDVIASVLDRLGSHLAGRPVRVMVRDDVPPVPIDVVQLDQVVTNLIENALRYSPQGSEIAISAIRWERWVEVRVSDHGPGIPHEDREAVFQEFYRRDVDGRKAGTGLGLSIARAVVAAHDGSMWVESTPGGGATIGFRLPLAVQGMELPMSTLPSL
jgi:two-component system sensor histidine kinase KdpD